MSGENESPGMSDCWRKKEKEKQGVMPPPKNSKVKLPQLRYNGFQGKIIFTPVNCMVEPATP